MFAFDAVGRAGVDLLLCGLGLPAESPPLEWLRGAGPRQLTALERFIAHHKVYPYVRRALEALTGGTAGGMAGGAPGAAGALLRRIDERWPLARRAGEAADERLRAVAAALRDYGGPVMLLKGAAYRLLMSPDPLRPQNDIDACVPGLDDLWRLGRHLLERGFELSPSQGTWLQRFARPGGAAEVHGSMALVRREPMPPGKPPGVDIRSGSVSVGLTAMMGFPLWQRAGRSSLAGVVFAVPAADDCLLVSVAHQYNHGHFLLRDALDVARLLRELGDRLDFPYTMGWARREGLERALCGLLSCAARFQPPGVRLAPAAAALAAAATLSASASALSGRDVETSCLLWATGWAHRHKNGAALLLSTLHTYNYERARRGRRRGIAAAWRNLIKLVWLMVSQARGGGRLASWLAPLARLRPAAGALREGNQVTLAWVEDDLPGASLLDRVAAAPGARALGSRAFLVRDGRLEVLATPAGWFVPVHGPFVSSGTFSRALALKERLTAP